MQYSDPEPGRQSPEDARRLSSWAFELVPMIILALDSAANACSAALLRDGGVVACRLVATERGHSECLAPLIRDVMTEAGISFSRVDVVAVTVGPGAFTGLRIGLATARGLALAAGVPCLGVTTLEAMAHAIPLEQRRGRSVLVVLDAKRSDVYGQAFTWNLEPLGPPTALLPHEVAGLVPAGPVVVAGDAAETVVISLENAGHAVTVLEEIRFPDAAVVAALVHARVSAGESMAAPAPLYLRPPDARIPTDGGRLRPRTP